MDLAKRLGSVHQIVGNHRWRATAFAHKASAMRTQSAAIFCRSTAVLVYLAPKRFWCAQSCLKVTRVFNDASSIELLGTSMPRGHSSSRRCFGATPLFSLIAIDFSDLAVLSA